MESRVKEVVAGDHIPGQGQEMSDIAEQYRGERERERAFVRVCVCACRRSIEIVSVRTVLLLY